MEDGATTGAERRPDFRRSLRLLLDRRRARLRRHPAAGALVDYHRRRLFGRDAERLREHLAACRACADLVLELASLWPMPPP